MVFAVLSRNESSSFLGRDAPRITRQCKDHVTPQDFSFFLKKKHPPQKECKGRIELRASHVLLHHREAKKKTNI